MPIVKHAYPILEYDTAPDGVINPNRAGRATLPAKCLMTFFGEVLTAFAEAQNAAEVNAYESEQRRFPIYRTVYQNKDICLIQATVGSASIATMTDYLIAHGVKQIILCGCCGVLSDIPAGDVILPVSALRDEGASYHYLPPAREIILDAAVVSSIKQTLAGLGAPFIEAKTWTTDGFLRETPDMIAYRKAEGCSVVEMECATVAAVAAFRGIAFGQLLYSGDILADFDAYDDRGWTQNLTAREKLFRLALAALNNLS